MTGSIGAGVSAEAESESDFAMDYAGSSPVLCPSQTLSKRFALFSSSLGLIQVLTA